MTEVDSGKRTYPYISANVWTELRSRFQKSVPVKVTSSYLQTALSFESEKAAKNLIPQLRALGIIDAEGSVSELARRFRLDDDYPAVAREMADVVYPSELRELFPGPDEDQGAVAGWFMRHTGKGQAAAASQARFYVALVSGNLPSVERTPRSANGSKPVSARKMKASAADAKTATQIEKPLPSPSGASESAQLPQQLMPGLHLDIQVHIDAAASVDQIDAVFASMAKHLYGR